MPIPNIESGAWMPAAAVHGFSASDVENFIENDPLRDIPGHRA